MVLWTLPLLAALAPRSLRQRVDAPRLPSISDAQQTAVKRLPRFLSDSDIQRLHDVAAEAKIAAGDRAVTATLDRQLREGGRTVWINHLIAERLPELHSRILAAAHAADAELWGGVLCDRAALNLRSAEYHTVVEEGGVAMGSHADFGSLVTIDLMLSSIDEFDGGRFETLEADGEVLAHTFECGDALIFLSHKPHGVSTLEAGRRNILVCEIWEGVARRCPQRCDHPWMPCYCSYRPFTLYEVEDLEDPRRSRRLPGALSDIELLRARGLAEHRAQLERAAQEQAPMAATAAKAEGGELAANGASQALLDDVFGDLRRKMGVCGQVRAGE